MASKKKKKGFSPPATADTAVGDINVTPLIDIVLVLLIIYMVVTSIMLNQFLVNLPEKSDSDDDDDTVADQFIVAACLEGHYAYIHTRGSSIQKQVPISLVDIVTTLEGKINQRQKKKTVIFVDAHPQAPYPNVVKLMDAVRESGKKSQYDVEIGIASLQTEKDFLNCTPPKGG